MDAESTKAETQDVAAKTGEAPPIKLDEVRPTKAEAASSAVATKPPAEKAAATKPAAEASAPVPPASKPAPKAPATAAASMTRLTTMAETYGYYAAGVVVALGLGWIVGANSFDSRAGEARIAEALTVLDGKIGQVAAKAATGNDVATLKRRVDEMKQGLDASRRNGAGLTELRNKIDAAERSRAAANDAMADKLADRLAKEQAERLERFSARLDVIEKQLSSQITTASIPAAAPSRPEPLQVPGVTMPMAATPAAKEAKKDEHTTVERSRLPENGYVLRDVYRGVAVVEGRRGLVEVAPGDSLPGAGRVRSIERRNRQWVVVTSSGVIDSNGY